MSESRSPYRPSAIIACRHKVDDHLVPCPPFCPMQSWPRSMFRISVFRDRWVLRRKFRVLTTSEADAIAASEGQA